ncbi:rhomboid family intramembrane serine protease [bacterium]|nr:rhomboid family intramembrane serine protease [bacterium]
MGIYDRDYGREAYSPWDRADTSRSITVNLIIVNVFVFIAELVTRDSIPTETGRVLDSAVIEWFAIDQETIMNPWLWWKFLTYGFTHDVTGINHLLFNMIGLFVFGRDVENRLGRKEFLRFYLSAVVIGGIVGSVTHRMGGVSGGTIGASGAVIATAILYACFFPNRELLLMLIIPVKAWVMATIFIATDLMGALGMLGEIQSFKNTAFTVHLAGAFFALGYHYTGWNLSKLPISGLSGMQQSLRKRSRRMRLKLHDPDQKLANDAKEADRILAKIHEQGESSLTSSERKVLERYSRRQREKRDL